jgi:hypothetical protein
MPGAPTRGRLQAHVPASGDSDLTSTAMSSPSSHEGENTGISVQTKFYAFNFLLYFYKPKISVDGNPAEKVPWGTTFIATTPGAHTVRCFVPYVYLRHMGDSTIDVRVPPGKTVFLRWQTPLGSLYLKGKWTVLDAQ